MLDTLSDYAAIAGDSVVFVQVKKTLNRAEEAMKETKDA